MATFTRLVGTPKTDDDGNIVRKGKVTFKALVRKTKHKPVTKTFDRMTDAKDWAALVEREMKEGRWGLSSEAEKHTLSDTIKRYRSQPDSKARPTILNWWDNEIGHLPLSEIRRSVIIECRDKLATTPTPARTNGQFRSPATVNRYLANISTVFTSAVEWEWIENNPVKGIKKGKELKRVRYLGMDGYPRTEAADLLKACKNSYCHQLYPLVVTAMNTGARAGELLGLDWKDVNFKRGTARLAMTKNGESRTIPISGRTVEVLKELRGDGRIGKVFASKAGAPVYSYSAAWQTALKEAGIENFKFHDLRHHAASMLAISGEPLHQIAHLLGHKGLAMTMRYAHLCDENVVDIGAKLDKLNFES